MKTTITSNGKQVDVILEGENPLEQAIINNIDLYKQSISVYRDDNNRLNIHINTDVK